MSPHHGALATHLREAIEINTARMPLYAELTRGRSIPFSKKLIRSEKIALSFSWIIDGLAKPYQKAGIPIADAEYISMSKIPAFSSAFPFPADPLSSFVPVDGKAMSKRLKKAMKNGGFKAVSEAATLELEKIKEPKTYHSMVRHLLESLIRAANFAPIHEAHAKKIGFRSPRFLSWFMVYTHFPMLASAGKWDEEFAIVQSEGIPFLWQDVPHIPAE